MTEASQSGESRPPQQRHSLPYYEGSGSLVNEKWFKDTYQEEIRAVEKAKEEVKAMVDRQEGEEDRQYELRVLDEMEKRIKYPGDYRGKEDPLFDKLNPTSSGLPQPDISLVVLDMEKGQIIKSLNDEGVGKQTRAMGKELRRQVRTEVDHFADVVTIGGEMTDVLEGKQWKDEPRKDMLSFTLVADQLLDVASPTGEIGGKTTYREQMAYLQNILRPDTVNPKTGETRPGSGATPQERDRAARQLVGLRREFYNQALQALEKRRITVDLNPHEDERTALEKTQVHMRNIVNGIQTKTIDQLISEYKGGTVQQLSPRHQQQIGQLLTGHQRELLDYALKGGNLMRRRISYAPKLREVPPLRWKKFVQEGVAEGETPPTAGLPPATPTTSPPPPPPAGVLPGGEGPVAESGTPAVPTTESEVITPPVTPAPAPVTTEPPGPATEPIATVEPTTGQAPTGPAVSARAEGATITVPVPEDGLAPAGVDDEPPAADQPVTTLTGTSPTGPAVAEVGEEGGVLPGVTPAAGETAPLATDQMEATVATTIERQRNLLKQQIEEIRGWFPLTLLPDTSRTIKQRDLALLLYRARVVPNDSQLADLREAAPADYDKIYRFLTDAIKERANTPPSQYGERGGRRIPLIGTIGGKKIPVADADRSWLKQWQQYFDEQQATAPPSAQPPAGEPAVVTTEPVETAAPATSARRPFMAGIRERLAELRKRRERIPTPAASAEPARVEPLAAEVAVDEMAARINRLTPENKKRLEEMFARMGQIARGEPRGKEPLLTRLRSKVYQGNWGLPELGTLDMRIGSLLGFSKNESAKTRVRLESRSAKALPLPSFPQKQRDLTAQIINQAPQVVQEAFNDPSRSLEDALYLTAGIQPEELARYYELYDTANLTDQRLWKCINTGVDPQTNESVNSIILAKLLLEDNRQKISFHQFNIEHQINKRLNKFLNGLANKAGLHFIRKGRETVLEKKPTTKLKEAAKSAASRLPIGRGRKPTTTVPTTAVAGEPAEQFEAATPEAELPPDIADNPAVRQVYDALRASSGQQLANETFDTIRKFAQERGIPSLEEAMRRFYEEQQ